MFFIDAKITPQIWCVEKFSYAHSIYIPHHYVGSDLLSLNIDFSFSIKFNLTLGRNNTILNKTCYVLFVHTNNLKGKSYLLQLTVLSQGYT